MNGTPGECVSGTLPPAYLRKVFEPETLGLDFVRNLFANGWRVWCRGFLYSF